MSNLFKKTSSNWVRYDKYEWKEDNAGTLYITPAPDAKPFLYNPLKDNVTVSALIKDETIWLTKKLWRNYLALINPVSAVTW